MYDTFHSDLVNLSNWQSEQCQVNSTIASTLKVISSHSLLAKVVAQFPIADAINLDDAIDWIYEATGWIGYHFEKIHRREKVEVVNFVVVTPADYVKLERILTVDGHCIPEGLQHQVGWKVCNGNITYTYETGEVVLEYLSTGEDEYGYPLVKDTYKYREAVSFFLLRRLMEGGYKHPILDYPTVDMKAERFKGLAANEWTPSDSSILAYLDRRSFDTEGDTGVISTRYTDRSIP